MEISFMRISGSSKFNIFVQEKEPKIKEGLWIQKQGKYNKVILDEKVVTDGFVLEPTGTYPFMPNKNECFTCIANDYIYFIAKSISNKSYKYNIKTQVYTEIAHIPTNDVSGYEAIFIPDKNKIFMSYNRTGIYDIDTDTWSYSYMGSSIATFYRYNFYYNGYIFNFYNSSSGSSGGNIYKYNLETKEATIAYSGYDGYSTAVAYAQVDKYVYIFKKDNTIYRFNMENNVMEKVGNTTGLDTIGASSSFNYAVFNNAVYGLRKLDSKVILFAIDLSTYEVKKYNIEDENIQSSSQWSYSNLLSYEKDNRIFIYFYYSSSSYVYLSLYFPKKAYTPNSVIINTGNKYQVQLLSTPEQLEGKILTNVIDAWHNTEGGLDTVSPTYYGNGTEWVKFKN